MKLTPDELAANGYVLLDKMGHKELIPFVRAYLKKRTKYAAFYYVSNLVLFGLVVFYFVEGYNLPGYSFGSRFTYFSYGLAISILLVPVHEFIHVLAYRSQGAKNTSYAANFKKFFFMALADKFVASKREFEIVALAPFLIISTVLLLIFPFANSNWQLTIFGILLAHTAMCSGDFGLLGFFEYHKKKEPVTYDDVENKVSYFYGRVNESHSAT